MGDDEASKAKDRGGESSLVAGYEEKFRFLAIWGAVAYGLGFLCILVHTARYGVQVIEVIKPLNFWVGALPTLVIFFSIFVWERYLSDVARRAAQQKMALVNRAAPPVASFLGRTSRWVVEVLRRARLRISGELSEETLAKWGKALVNLVVLLFAFGGQILFSGSEKLPPGWLNSAKRFGLILLGAISALIIAIYFWSWLRSTFEKHAQFRLAFLCCLPVAFSFYYIGFVYPFIPHEAGGGWPAKVQLVLDPEAFQGSPLANTGILQGGAEGKSFYTSDLCLLYEASDTYLVDVKCSVLSHTQAAAVITIPGKHVRAVIWKGRPPYDHPPFFVRAGSWVKSALSELRAFLNRTSQNKASARSTAKASLYSEGRGEKQILRFLESPVSEVRWTPSGIQKLNRWPRSAKVEPPESAQRTSAALPRGRDRIGMTTAVP